MGRLVLAAANGLFRQAPWLGIGGRWISAHGVSWSENAQIGRRWTCKTRTKREKATRSETSHDIELLTAWIYGHYGPDAWLHHAPRNDDATIYARDALRTTYDGPHDDSSLTDGLRNYL